MRSLSRLIALLDLAQKFKIAISLRTDQHSMTSMLDKNRVEEKITNIITEINSEIIFLIFPC